MSAPNETHLWWEALRHGGVLIAPAHLRARFPAEVEPLPPAIEERLRRDLVRFEAARSGAQDAKAASALLDTVLHKALGLGDPAHPESGYWLRGADVTPEWTQRSVTGEAIRPRRVWCGDRGSYLPVFWTDEPRLGVGRGRRAAARVTEWLRRSGQRLALVTNGAQWRVTHAGLDHEAWAESDAGRWFEAGAQGAALAGLRALLSPATLIPPATGTPAALSTAIEASRRSQAELSSVLGERVRQAVETLIREHGESLGRLMAADREVTAREVYRAATRVVMRMVIVLFAEARELLPRADERYHDSYGLESLRDSLERAGGASAAGGARAERLRHRFGAWPRVLALFRLVAEGSPHPAFAVPRYGGDLFATGAPDAAEPLARALHVFEREALEGRQVMPDSAVLHLLRLLTRSEVRVRQGNRTIRVPGPVDFSDLSSEYIGILYEGLLDYELKRAGERDPVVILALGDEPALPLSRLEPMEDEALRELLKKAKQKRELAVSEDEGESEDAGEETGEDDDAEGAEAGEVSAEETAGAEETAAAEECSRAEAAGAAEEAAEEEPDDARETARARVIAWAKGAAIAGRFVPKHRKSDDQAEHERRLEAAARGLIARTVLPGEWYLVRFGGTRKGAGTFYTRPQLAVPTTHRTLRPLAWDPPAGAGGKPDPDAPPAAWAPKHPEEVLKLRVCDPACGSGSFLVAALRFLTEALFASLFHHHWIERRDDGLALGTPPEPRPPWLIECLPDRMVATEDAESRLRVRLRRVVVERCLYGVDLDPLAVELARLSLWVETLDRDLPFTFLDHKVKCGNSLVGAWFDRFREYPLLAWERKSGDEDHTRGTHFAKGARERALKARRAQVKDDLVTWLQRRAGQETAAGILGPGVAEQAHEAAHAVMDHLHALPLHEAEARAHLYREAFLGDAAIARLREGLDLWCALWFWPAEDATHAPLATGFAAPGGEARAIAARVARERRFFHWEVEFPDVFARAGAGFDAVLGNPPWETIQPQSKEFFSDLDPLYRAYGKREALGKQADMFRARSDDERDWLDYVAYYKSSAHFFKHAATPFGDPQEGGEKASLARGRAGDDAHALWRARRARWEGYADPAHPFRHMGDGKPYTYRLFLEQAHALLRDGGRLGFIVPSGLYTDKGSTTLRELFLSRCRWEWLFGFENRDKVFDIDSRFKFGPLIVQKCGTTEAIRTAFMRRDLADWEEGERHAIPYARAQVERFSPRTRAILEIRHPRDLEILEKVYAGSVLLGDESPEGWRIQYAQGDFNMTSDSDKFKPRPWWEERGYRPDLYGRRLKFDPARVERGDARFMQPGWIHLREGGYVHEGAVEDVALPLYEGRMIGQFDFSQKGWVSGKGRGAVWREIPWEEKRIEPQYCMARHLATATMGFDLGSTKVCIMDIGSATNERTTYATFLARVPCGHSAPVLRALRRGGRGILQLVALLNSFSFDSVLRIRLGGLHLTWNYLEEARLPHWETGEGISSLITPAMALCATSPSLAPEWLNLAPQPQHPWRRLWAITPHERLRLRCMLDAIVAALYGLAWDDFAWILRDCDHPTEPVRDKAFARTLDPKGFWRVDKERDPELRHTVLSLVAMRDLERCIANHGGDCDRGIEAFCAQHDGDGWMLPETLCLADFGIGHDDRAREPQPVRERLGERFLPWQVSQSVEESWAECEWHARNILGEQGYERLQRRLRGEVESEEALTVAEGPVPEYPGVPGGQRRLIPGQPDLFGGEYEDIPKKRRRKSS
ncbi:MAG: hypothetical protein HZC42_00730 [Candidatus Eisenbacteria bacterium]|nr:hypothetical protein [Candidatus Eisenbacteria bacterium]